MASLASIADLTARGITVEPSETTIVQQYLDVASAIVRDAAGSPISQTAGTVKLEGVTDQWLKLPGQPVSAVAAVSIDGTAVTDYKLRTGSLWRDAGWRPLSTPSEVSITYTHGLATVPADIVDLVCRLAVQALVAFRSGGAEAAASARSVTSERIGDYAVTYDTSTDMGTMALSDWQRARLAARFGGGAAVVRLR